MKPLDFLLYVEKTLRNLVPALPAHQHELYLEWINSPTYCIEEFYDSKTQAFVVAQYNSSCEFKYGVECSTQIKIPKNSLDEKVVFSNAAQRTRGFLRFPIDGICIEGIIYTENFSTVTDLDFILAGTPLCIGDYVLMPTTKGKKIQPAVKKCVAYGYNIISKSRKKSCRFRKR